MEVDKRPFRRTVGGETATNAETRPEDERLRGGWLAAEMDSAPLPHTAGGETCDRGRCGQVGPRTSASGAAG